LVNNYLTSVGRASNLILNIAPDGTGAVPPIDVKQYAAMGAAIKCLFNHSVAKSTAPMKMVAATGVLAPELGFPPLSAAAAQNLSVVVREDQTMGQLINAWSLECRATAATADQWGPCPVGSLSGSIPKCTPSPESGGPCVYTGIGHKRIVVIGAAPASLSGVRVVVHSHFATGTQVPTVRDVELFDFSQTKSCV
jgi:hypothetical protein